jgi:hypothetical protein
MVAVERVIIVIPSHVMLHSVRALSGWIEKKNYALKTRIKRKIGRGD